MIRGTNMSLGAASGVVLAAVGLAWATSNPHPPSPDTNPPATPDTPVHRTLAEDVATCPTPQGPPA